MKNVATITRSTSMPIIAAASRSNDVARIALPSCVRCTKSVRHDHQHDRADHDDDLREPRRARRTGSVKPFVQSSPLFQL